MSIQPTRFAGKTALVTGGTSGIGRATTIRLAQEGATVVFCGSNLEAAAEVVRETRTRAIFKACDVGEEDDAQALVAFTLERCGRLDILINNAAKAAAREIAETSTEEWRATMAVTLDAVFYLSRAAIPIMRQQKGGAIVNVASISGMAGDGAYPAYCAHKAAVINLTRSMAVYHARENIRINAICPGLIETPAVQPLWTLPGLKDKWLDLIPARRAGTSEEMAAAIAFLASDDASYLAGSILVADGGVTAATGQPTQTPFT
jgi:meso-butanediol dehydrogenase / (S,S)-butanediol dehydrogenase / diacetyl reductase